MRKTLLLLLLTITTLSAFGQTGTTISYTDQFGSLTLTYNGLINGKHSYLGPDGTKARWSGTRWEVRYNNDTEILYYSNANTSMNPPNLSVGNWQIGPNGGCCLMTTFSGTGTTSIVLPIELMSFNAQNTEGGKNYLTWTTTSEENNKHFDIERSIDGNSFYSIAQVAGNNKPSSYQYTDNQPFSTTYYRLRQVDFDGTATYSKVVSVTNKGGKALKVYPTLVSNGFLTVDGEGSDYAIYNIVGQQVQNGKTTQRLDVSSLAKGTYILKVGTEQAKFVKQ